MFGDVVSWVLYDICFICCYVMKGLLLLFGVGGGWQFWQLEIGEGLWVDYCIVKGIVSC